MIMRERNKRIQRVNSSKQPNSEPSRKPNPYFRTLQTVSFVLSILVFILGVDLLAVSLWSFTRKLPYYLLLEVRVDITYFTIAASALCLPIFSIHLSTRWSEVRIYLIHTVITLQVISVCILIAALNVGLMYTYKENDTLTRLTSSLDIKELNSSMHLSILRYDTSPTTKFAWNQVQQQLKCCGIKHYEDWIVSGQRVPSSCCSIETCNRSNTFSQGCLDNLSRDLVWHKNVLISHCCVGVIIHTAEAIIVAVMYLSAKEFDK